MAFTCLTELLQAEGASENSIPLVQKLMIPLRGALTSSDKTIYNKGLESLKLLAETVGGHLNPHMHILLAQLNKKLSDKTMREKVMSVLNVIEEQGGPEALKILRSKIPTYASIYA